MSNKFITTYKGGFTILPNTFILNPNVTSQAKALMLLLMQYAWTDNECFPSIETITYHLDWSKDSFQKYKKELIDKGFISVGKMNETKKNEFNPIPAAKAKGLLAIKAIHTVATTAPTLI